MHKVVKTLEINKPLEEVFQFFNTPKNLSRLMPKLMGFKLLTPEPIIMKEGAVFDYQIRMMGLPMRWTSYISEYDPPNAFADIQLKGPNSYWHHRHRFVANGDSTTVIDEVHYMLPLGILGRIANALVMKWMVSYIFNYRTKVVDAVFKESSDEQ